MRKLAFAIGAAALMLLAGVLTAWRCSMGLLNAVYMKFKAFIRFIERTDEEFLAGEVDDR